MLEPKKLGSWVLDGKLTKIQLVALEELSITPHFNGLVDSLSESEAQWHAFLEHPSAEHHVPEPWFNGSDLSTTNSTARALKKLLVVKALRPDRLIYSISHFAAFVLGDEITG
jgi:dynein heavy chain 1